MTTLSRTTGRKVISHQLTISLNVERTPRGQYLTDLSYDHKFVPQNDCPVSDESRLSVLNSFGPQVKRESGYDELFAIGRFPTDEQIASVVSKALVITCRLVSDATQWLSRPGESISSVFLPLNGESEYLSVTEDDVLVTKNITEFNDWRWFRKDTASLYPFKPPDQDKTQCALISHPFDDRGASGDGITVA